MAATKSTDLHVLEWLKSSMTRTLPPALFNHEPTTGGEGGLGNPPMHNSRYFLITN